LTDAVIKTTPFNGAGTTVSQLRSYIIEAADDHSIRAVVEQICEGITARDYLSEYLAILRFVESNTRYMRDPRTVELVKNPSEIMGEILAGHTPQVDCDDMAGLIGAMVQAAGGDVKLVTVAFQNIVYSGIQQFSHVFVCALEPKTRKWVVLDPVAGKNTKSMLSRTVVAKIWNVG
jgi:hypothetical protein